MSGPINSLMSGAQSLWNVFGNSSAAPTVQDQVAVVANPSATQVVLSPSTEAAQAVQIPIEQNNNNNSNSNAIVDATALVVLSNTPVVVEQLVSNINNIVVDSKPSIPAIAAVSAVVAVQSIENNKIDLSNNSNNTIVDLIPVQVPSIPISVPVIEQSAQNNNNAVKNVVGPVAVPPAPLKVIGPENRVKVPAPELKETTDLEKEQIEADYEAAVNLGKLLKQQESDRKVALELKKQFEQEADRQLGLKLEQEEKDRAFASNLNKGNLDNRGRGGQEDEGIWRAYATDSTTQKVAGPSEEEIEMFKNIKNKLDHSRLGRK